MSVAVFVFGDIGRSPRMQNHATELSKLYEKVYLIGYEENPPSSSILNNPRIQCIDMSLEIIKKLKNLKIFYLYALLRILIQTIQMLWLFMFGLPGLRFVLVQNPPSIPVLSSVWFGSLVRKYKVIIDFHNYGYTILRLNVKNRLINSLAEKYQKFFGKRCYQSLCVSKMMRDNLRSEWKIDSVTLYDRPHTHTQSVDRTAMLAKVGVRPKNNDLVIVSSTSWTKDEDFGILLKSLEKYEAENAKNPSAPKIYTLITGKGPQKERYLEYIKTNESQWNKIEVKTLWLEADDYPRLLASCDLGVCLHYSSSGLDLPMKVVDMFSAGIPVLAINYEAINQLVMNKKNGLIFSDSQQLYRHLQDIANDRSILSGLWQGVKLEQAYTFEKEWEIKFKPLIKDL